MSSSSMSISNSTAVGSSSSGGGSSGNGHIQVYCRVRPQSLSADHESTVSFPFAMAAASANSNSDTSSAENGNAPGSISKVLLQQSPAQITIADKSHFAVDRLFYEVNQQDMFQETLYPILEHDVFTGIHCTLFSYGQTGSGKTHTLLGNAASTEEQGLLPRAMEFIFQKITSLSSQNIHYSCQLKVSIVEIYHEKLKDLLATNSTSSSGASSSSGATGATGGGGGGAGGANNSNSLVIREHADGTIWVEHLREISIKSMQEFQQLLSQALKRRVVGGHKLNEVSSRSHLCCLIQMLQVDKEQQHEIFSKLSIIDLAGSEMAKKTGAEGQRFQEAKFINKSLSALSNVISALAMTSSTSSSNALGSTSNSLSQTNPSTNAANNANSNVHIPYRDSKLTRLLQNSLNGSSKTIIILTISAAKQHTSETISTLKFGERARLIKITPKVHQQIAETDEHLRETIKELRHQMKILQQTITKLQEEQHPILPSLTSSRLNALLQSPGTNVASPMQASNSATANPMMQQLICEICQSFIDQNVTKSTPAKEKKEVSDPEDEDDDGEVKKKTKKGNEKKKKKKGTSKKLKKKKQEVLSDDDEEEDGMKNRKFLFFPSGAGQEDEGEETSSPREEEDPEEDEDEEEEDVSDRCGICNMNEEESDQMRLDTGEELGFFINCDGNCGSKFHIRCIGLVGDGGQYTMPDGEWFCTLCESALQDDVVSNVILSHHKHDEDAEVEEGPADVEKLVEEAPLLLAENVKQSSEEGDDEFKIRSKLTTSDPASVSSPSTHHANNNTNLIPALQTLHCRYELMRKERNRILLQWQQEKKMQQHIEVLKQKKQQKELEDRQVFEEEKQHFHSTVKSLEDENSLLRQCLQEVQQTIANQHHSSNGLSASQSWVPLSSSMEMQSMLFPKFSNSTEGTDESNEEDDRQANEEGGDNNADNKEIIPKPWLQKKSLSSPKNINGSSGSNKNYVLPSSKGILATSSQRNLNDKNSDTDSIGDTSKGRNHQSLPSFPTYKLRSKADESAVEEAGDEGDDSLFPPKEPSRFIHPLRNRLSDLLALVKQEADSYAEIRNKYQSREEHRHELRQGGGNNSNSSAASKREIK